MSAAPAPLAVWAPRAATVELETGGGRVEMSRTDDGWHETEWPAPGSDYRFVIDGTLVRPDPRSRHQPEGVHGPSRVVDRDAFAWSDDDWRAPPLSDWIVYELHVGTFSTEGTFDGVIDRLDYLVDLGITTVELMPVAEFSGSRGWGYDGVGLYAPHHVYGGPGGLARLVDACHAKGLAVVLDVVYNHLGPEGNYLRDFGPYFTTRYATPWGEAINFDGPDSDPVRRFFVDNALMWLRDFHFDGLRLDAVHAILDTSAVHILEQLATEVDELEVELGRPLYLIAESDLNDPRVVRPGDQGGYGIDAQWSDDYHHALHTVLTGERDGYYADFGSLGHLAKALTNAYVYDGIYSPYRRRVHGRPPTGLSGNSFFGYAQNHDQVGNRARGDRISHLVSPELCKVAAALTLLGPHVPMIFQGEEWGATTPFLYFTDHGDPALGRAVSEGRRREFAAFGWDPADVPDPQAEQTFWHSKLDWAEHLHGAPAEILDRYKEWIRLRRATPELRSGRLDEVEVEHDGESRLLVRRPGVEIECDLANEKVAVARR